MAKNVIRLDPTKPHSTCHGERTPDDPHYNVHFFQPYKVGKKTILLPFNQEGVLVADTHKEPYKGLVEGKEVMFQPLYNDDMRALVKKLEEKVPEPEEEDDEPVIAGSTSEDDAGKAVDLRAWLRGQFKLSVAQVRSAMKAQHGLNPQTYKEALDFLVNDVHVVPESEVAEDLKRYLGR
jgi:hypothetical protein